MLLSIQTYCAGNDTILPNYLQDIDIIGEKVSTPIKNDGAKTLSLDMEYFHNLPKILGNADPLRYTQMLPGIQLNSEVDAGIHIYGNESSHNQVSLQGVPVYNPTHILGLFSVFNPTHFSRMSVTKNSAAADGCNRIGGVIDMELRNELPGEVKGDFTAGLMSSQGTLQIPLGKKAALFTSLRLSYLNLLYSSFLKYDDAQLYYSFGDVNITYLHKINHNNTLHIDFYTGIDDAEYQSPGSSIYSDIGARWGNMLGAAHWDHRYRHGNIRQTLYYSGYANMMFLQGNYNLRMPSGVNDFGYRSDAVYKNLKYGISLVCHNIEPQAPLDENQSIVGSDGSNRQKALEGCLYVRYSGQMFRYFNYEAALKGDLYSNLQGYDYQALNPYLKLGYGSVPFGDVELSYSTQHQYMHNSGFTALGLPVEFWFGADSRHKPQIAHTLQLSYRREFLNGKYDVGIDAYCKRLYNQVEYKASPLDILNKQYSMDDAIICGDGYNYGASIMVNKLTGKLTGWVAYSYGRALRKFDVYGDKWFPSNHERIHELDVVASYKINDRMDFGGTFAYASGTPYTKVKYMYMINGNILSEFGEHNSSRLRDYIRLDLSVNYDIIKKDGCTFGANFSLFNALFRSNDIYYGIKQRGDSFRFQCTSFITTALPSVSIYYKF